MRLPILLCPLLVLHAVACAAPGPSTSEPVPELPAPVRQALSRLKLPAHSLSVVVRHPVTGQERLSLQAERPMNPASMVKLFTTFAALEQLGPSWTWRTPVWLDGRISGIAPGAVLEGHLHIKGVGDPKLNTERLWSLLQQIRQMGVVEIAGDIVLDQSAFEEPTEQPGDFDGEPLKPYNVQPRALMLNQRTVSYGFVPDPSAGVARITADPPLAGVTVSASVPLSAQACGDWRAELKASFTPADRVRFSGRYPAACGVRHWHVAHPEPALYDARLLKALWQAMGGRLQGRVREGPAPSGPPTWEWVSPPLSDVVRDINRYSNNTMAQQVALTLALHSHGGARVDAAQARHWLQQWAQTRVSTAGLDDALRIDNGSGLSRQQRVSAHHLARLLQQAWASPVLPEFIGSLPATGASDGTLRRWTASAGRAHLKSGSLRDVLGAAGYALGKSGQRWIVVVMVQHDRAQEARPVLDALLQWVIEDETVLRSSPRPSSP